MKMKNKNMTLKKIREIEKATLRGLAREGCRKANKDCACCPMAIETKFGEGNDRFKCCPREMVKGIMMWQSNDMQ